MTKIMGRELIEPGTERFTTIVNETLSEHISEFDVWRERLLIPFHGSDRDAYNDSTGSFEEGGQIRSYLMNQTQKMTRRFKRWDAYNTLLGIRGANHAINDSIYEEDSDTWFSSP